MKKKLLLIPVVGLSLLLTSCGNDYGFSSIKDETKKAEVVTALQSVKMFSSTTSMNSSSSTSNSVDTYLNNMNYNADNELYINATLSLDISWGFISASLTGTLQGTNINNDSYKYLCKIYSGSSLVVDAIFASNTINLTTYDYSIAGQNILSAGTSKTSFDGSGLTTFFSQENVDYFETFKMADTDVDIKGKTDDLINYYLVYQENIDSFLSSLDETYKEYANKLSNVYVGPALDKENVLNGFATLANLNYGVDFSLCFKLNIDNSVKPSI
ncbi:MAG: hypothetical protein WCR97_01005 [Bacilli bacterium]